MADLLSPGAPAPDVTFFQGQERLRLQDLRGSKKVVVAFYGAAFTGG